MTWQRFASAHLESRGTTALQTRFHRERQILLKHIVLYTFFIYEPLFIMSRRLRLPLGECNYITSFSSAIYQILVRFFFHYSLFIISHKGKMQPSHRIGTIPHKSMKRPSQKYASEFALDNAGSIRSILSKLDHRDNTWLGVTDYSSMHKDGVAIWKRGTGRSNWREPCWVAVKHGLRNRNGSFLVGISLRQIFPFFCKIMKFR
jgi:hypothetical protein